MSSNLIYNNDKSIVLDPSGKTFYLLRDITFALDQMDDFTSINTSDINTRLNDPRAGRDPSRVYICRASGPWRARSH